MNVRIEHFEGREAVASQTIALEGLAVESRQDGAAQGLAYTLDEEFAARKVPHLICFREEETGSKHEGKLLGAVLLFEYRVGRFRTGWIATGDSFGVRTVFAPEISRQDLVASSCEFLLDQGAKVVLVTFRQRSAMASSLWRAGANGTLWAVDSREVQDSLVLGQSYEETISRLGKKTRTNLRACRRKFDELVPHEFVPDAISRLPLDDDRFFEQLNNRSLDPVPQAMFNLRIRATSRLPSGFVSGLWSPTTGWLALVGGWRQNLTTWIEWQYNASGSERFSVSTVLRSFLIQEEIKRNTTRLSFHGGTSHSMSHSFENERVVDILARRPGVLVSVLVSVAATLFSGLPRLKRRGNFLGDALSRRGTWKSNLL